MSARSRNRVDSRRGDTHAISRKRAAAPLVLAHDPQAEPLSWGERLNIIEVLLQVLDGVYAHLTLKHSLYGFDVIRGLEHLRQEMPKMSDLEFHRALTSLINRLRDAHTQYQGRLKGSDPVASLPFLVEWYGPSDAPEYIVSKVDRDSVPDRHFARGVTIEHWNGIPFSRAVELHAESETGGRPDARRARALESLTFRALEYAPPPNEEWVVLGYRDLKKRKRELRLKWETFDPDRDPAASKSVGTRVRRGINAGAEAVRRAKKYRFNPKLWREEAKHVPASGRNVAGTRDFADFLTAKTFDTRHGKIGYLRIWSFDVEDDERFLRATISLLRRMPDRGLIIDLRNNPGGFIWAAERLLQLFTPNQITPTKFALRATPATAAMAQAPFNQADLAPWTESLSTAQQTGEPYSSHLPITPPEQCNDVGQHYSGPVVVVVDANTYSSGDLFTAGFLDNRIGTVVCIGEATGAGGANVWGSDDLMAALAAADRKLPRLPDDIRFTVAIRRAVRSCDADGTLIEDAGVPGQPYAMTKADILHGNRDLIEHCAEILAAQPRTAMEVRRQGRWLSVATRGLDQLDLAVNGHPGGRPIRLRGDGNRRIPLPANASDVEISGFSGEVLCQKRRLQIAERT